MADWVDDFVTRNAPAQAPKANLTTPPSVDWVDQYLSSNPPPPSAKGPSVPPAAPSPLPWYARVPAGMAAAGVEGIAAGLGIPGDLERLGTQYVANPLSRYFGLSQNDPSATLFPKSSDFMSLPGMPWLHSQLAPGGPLSAQNEGERLSQAFMSGLGTTALPAAFSGGWTLPMSAAGGFGGVASQGAADLGAPPAVQLAAGLAAGGAVQGASALLGRRTLGHVASDLGSSQTYEDAGSILRAEAENFKNTVFPRTLAAAEAPVNAAVPGATQGDHSNLVGALGLLYARGGEDAISARSFMQKMASSGGKVGQTAKNINNYFDDVNKYNTLGGTPPAVPAVTWAEGRNFRTNGLGNWVEKSPSDTTSKKLLWGASSEDLRQIADSQGARDLFDSYNQTASRLYDLRDGPIQRVLDAPSDGAAARQLINRASVQASGQELDALRGALPTGVDELAAAHLRLNPNARAWARLAPEVQQGLVPSADDRAIVQATGPFRGEPGTQTRMLESLAGGEWLSRLGGLAAGGLGYNPKYGEYLGGLVGQSLPFGWRAAVNTFRHPALPMTGAAGAVGPMYMR